MKSREKKYFTELLLYLYKIHQCCINTTVKTNILA